MNKTPPTVAVTVLPDLDPDRKPNEAIPVQPLREGPPPETVLDLLQVASGMGILGVIRLAVDEIYDVGAWVQVLPDPQVFARRDKDTGTRYLHVSAQHRGPPIWGAITVCWCCKNAHPFWTRLLAGDDLAPGDERELSTHHILATLARLRIAHPPPIPDTPHQR